jgi:hypothetical protein
VIENNSKVFFMEKTRRRAVCACLAVACTCTAINEKIDFCSDYRAISWCPVADMPPVDAPQRHGSTPLPKDTLTVTAFTTGAVAIPIDTIFYRT